MCKTAWQVSFFFNFPTQAHISYRKEFLLVKSNSKSNPIFRMSFFFIGAFYSTQDPSYFRHRFSTPLLTTPSMTVELTSWRKRCWNSTEKQSLHQTMLSPCSLTDSCNEIYICKQTNQTVLHSLNSIQHKLEDKSNSIKIKATRRPHQANHFKVIMQTLIGRSSSPWFRSAER